MTDPLEEKLCPVYGCTLPLELHDPVDPEAGFDCDPDSLWHANEPDGVCWPEPLVPAPLDPKQFEPQPLYGAYEERFQREVRERHLQWVRGSWLSSVADIDFECFFLGSPATFSGDLRPTDRAATRTTADLAWTEQHRKQRKTHDS